MALPFLMITWKLEALWIKYRTDLAPLKGDGLKLIQLKRDNQSVKGMVAIAAKFNYFQNE